MLDQYHTLSGPSEGVYKEKGSRFFAFAFPVKNQEDISACLEGVHKQYHDARHVCYAWRLGAKGEPFRANDDGEPSHSAGDPILNEMRSLEVSDALIAVVRYFGGTKLGVGGLIRAYGTAAREALEANQRLEVTLTERISIRYPYDRTSDVKRILHQLKIEAVEANYTADCQQIFDVRLTDVESVRRVFEDLGILEKEKK